MPYELREEIKETPSGGKVTFQFMVKSYSSLTQLL